MEIFRPLSKIIDTNTIMGAIALPAAAIGTADQPIHHKPLQPTPIVAESPYPPPQITNVADIPEATSNDTILLNTQSDENAINTVFDGLKALDTETKVAVTLGLVGLLATEAGFVLHLTENALWPKRGAVYTGLSAEAAALSIMLYKLWG